MQLPDIGIAGDFIVKPNWTLGPRKIAEYELVYFPVGSLSQYIVGERKYPLPQGSVILTRPNVEHSYRFDPQQSTRHWFVHFKLDPALPCPLPILEPSGPDCCRLQESSVVPILMKQLFRHAQRRSRRSTTTYHCRLLLHTILSELQESLHAPPAAHDVSVPPPLMAAQEYMRSKLDHPSLTILEIAKAIGWSHAHFARQFVRHFGVSPRESLLRMRIEQAARLLVQEQWPIGAVAEAVGFTDAHYFSRAFRRQIGYTASAYRVAFTQPINSHLVHTDDRGEGYPLNHYFVLPDDG